MLARDIMHRDVVTVTPYMTLKELARVLCDNRISGTPVVDRHGKVVGVVSQTDLVRAEREHSASEPAVYHHETDESASAAGFHYEDPDTRRVEQIMTPGGLSCREDATVEEVSRLMLARGIHRVLIIRNGTLSGIVTATDVIRAFLSERATANKKAVRAS